MGSLVDDMLLLARLDQGRPLERQPVDLTRITRDAVDDARAVAPEPADRLLAQRRGLRPRRRGAAAPGARQPAPEREPPHAARHAGARAGRRAATTKRSSRSPTRARAWRARTRAGCSNGSGVPIRRAPAPAVARDSGSRSSPRSPRRARRARAEVQSATGSRARRSAVAPPPHRRRLETRRVSRVRPLEVARPASAHTAMPPASDRIRRARTSRGLTRNRPPSGAGSSRASDAEPDGLALRGAGGRAIRGPCGRSTPPPSTTEVPPWCTRRRLQSATRTSLPRCSPEKRRTSASGARSMPSELVHPRLDLALGQPLRQLSRPRPRTGPSGRGC